MSAEALTDPASRAAAPAEPAPGHPARSRPGPGRAGWVALALLAAWLVPAGLHLVHAGALLPPLVLLLTAALLRGGETLLDRLVTAAALLIGLCCAVGLLFSVWPWGFHPVAVTGAALTVLVLLALATGRRPRFSRPGWADLLLAGGAGLLALYLAKPYLLAAGFTQRLGLAIGGEDNSRHLALFDLLGRIDGYAFVAPEEARQLIFSGMVYYPQGWHLTAALLDGFTRQPGAEPGVAAFNHYVFWVLAGYGFMLLSLIWAAHRIANRPPVLPTMVLTAVVGALCLGTELPRLLAAGYPTESLGLALVAIVAALVVRPVDSTREQILLLAALLVAVGFVYYLFVAPAAAMVLVWLLADHRAARTHWRTLLAIALPTIVLAPLTAVLGVLYAGQSEALNAPGPQVFGSYTTMLGVGAVVVAGLAAGGAWRDSGWRRYLAVVSVALLFAFGIAAVNLAQGLKPAYYFGKAAHLCVALLIVGVGAAVRLLPGPRPAEQPVAGRRRIVPWIGPSVVAAAVTLAVAVTTGVAGWTGGAFHRSKEDITWADAWVQQHPRKAPQTARVAALAYRQYPPQPGTMTLIVDTTAMHGYLESTFYSALQGTTARTEPGLYGMKFKEPERTRQILRRAPGPVRLIVADPNAQQAIDTVLAEEPELAAKVTVVSLNP
ncbi:hypothetical protein [Plantactinospora sp. GCM10030261]|uniref:hypothetical protein n=1 Tax=Plantactinospora sp. GCM10030261 TaxID=3273420 RepID=UPI00360A6C21